MNVKKTTQRQGFKTNEFIVYPAHGVGQIISIEEQEVAGARLELFVISFIKDKMTLRVPTSKVASVGMRKLAETPMIKRALETLKGRARIKRTMWSRRAQEYEAKINSGDIVAIAEVVRDLYRSDTQPEQSYSERQLYEAALDRLSREIAAVQRITETEAVKEIEAALAAFRETTAIYKALGLDNELDAQVVLGNMGTLEVRTGHLRDAEGLLKDAFEHERALAGDSGTPRITRRRQRDLAVHVQVVRHAASIWLAPDHLLAF